MSSINIALLGFGTVGRGVYESVQSHQEKLQFFLGKPVKIVAVLVRNLSKHHLDDKEVLLTDSFDEMMKRNDIDIVIDAIVGTEPGHTYTKRAIEKGCHVITANKEMFAQYGPDLLSLAEKHRVSIGFEATVGGGIPVIQTLRKLLNVNNITKVEGIINGTSNFILSSMREKGLSFEEALATAQENGYAEANPTNDVEGFDAFYKAFVLSHVAFGELPQKEDVIRKGISNISQEQIQSAESIGLRFKHMVKIKKYGSRMNCTVQPVLVSNNHPFYNIEGVQNAVSIDADIVGNISLSGPGAGKLATASAVLEDILHLYQEQIPTFVNKKQKEKVPVNEDGKWMIFNSRTNPSLLQEMFAEVEQLQEDIYYVSGLINPKLKRNHLDAIIYPIEGDFQPVNAKKYAKVIS